MDWTSPQPVHHTAVVWGGFPLEEVLPRLDSFHPELLAGQYLILLPQFRWQNDLTFAGHGRLHKG